MAQHSVGRLNWPQLVMDHCFLFQLRLLYLWLHKSLPHEIKKKERGLLIPHCFPAAPGTVETLRHRRCTARHRRPLSDDLADCGSFTYHSGGTITT